MKKEFGQEIHFRRMKGFIITSSIITLAKFGYKGTNSAVDAGALVTEIFIFFKIRFGNLHKKYCLQTNKSFYEIFFTINLM